MKALFVLMTLSLAAGAADLVIGSQGMQSSDPWCGS
jgi:hypothetical protein